MKKFILSFFITFVFIISTFAQEFSADVTTKTAEGIMTGKIYTTQGKSRMEMTGQGTSAKMIFISRQDKKVVWILMPGNMYMEQSFKPENIVASKDKIDGEVERKLIGKEKVNGVDAEKYKITVMADGQKKVIFIWFDKDSFPVKMTDEAEKFVTEYKNIKKEKPAAALFELPEGYKKFEMPKM